jgi:hypothetical protein
VLKDHTSAGSFTAVRLCLLSYQQEAWDRGKTQCPCALFVNEPPECDVALLSACCCCCAGS